MDYFKKIGLSPFKAPVAGKQIGMRKMS